MLPRWFSLDDDISPSMDRRRKRPCIIGERTYGPECLMADKSLRSFENGERVTRRGRLASHAHNRWRDFFPVKVLPNVTLLRNLSERCILFIFFYPACLFYDAIAAI